jgi:hypothetical protein
VHVRHGVGGTRRERRRDGGHPNNDGTRFDQASRQGLWKSRNPIPQPRRKLGTQSRELGSKVPNSKRDGNSGSRCTFVSNTHKLGPSPPPHVLTRDETRLCLQRWREDERIFEIVEESFSTLLTHFGNVYARGSRYIIILTERRE